ncbi:hypothetical protein ACFQZ4_49735 [Catellatospora coxensis]
MITADAKLLDDPDTTFPVTIDSAPAQLGKFAWGGVYSGNAGRAYYNSTADPNGTAQVGLCNWSNRNGRRRRPHLFQFDTRWLGGKEFIKACQHRRGLRRGQLEPLARVRSRPHRAVRRIQHQAEQAHRAVGVAADRGSPATCIPPTTVGMGAPRLPASSRSRPTSPQASCRTSTITGTAGTPRLPRSSRRVRSTRPRRSIAP